MHKLYELKDKLLDELEMYSGKQNMSKEDVETIKYLSSAIDHICNIVDGMEEEYSGDGMSYRDGRSYAMGGRSYARKRDAMGRYSRAEDDFVQEMRSLMAEAPNERIRQKMQSIMSDM